ncbi:uncharacterized protein RCH25_036778 [Pelodytes ibericus]
MATGTNVRRSGLDVLQPFGQSILPISRDCIMIYVLIVHLSSHLSSVNQERDQMVYSLHQLREEHVSLNSTLTSNMVTKDKVTQTMEEVLRKTRAELDRTRDLLNERQDELDSAMNQRQVLQSSLNSCHIDIENVKDQLHETEQQQSRCVSDLRVSQQQRDLSNQNLNRVRRSLMDTQDNLKMAQGQLTAKENELSSTKRDLRQATQSLQGSKSAAENLRKDFTTLSQKWTAAQACVPANCETRNDDYLQLEPFEFCPSGWKRIDHICYYFSRETTYRLAANEDCTKRGGTLAKIDDDNHELKTWIQQSKKSYWIGLIKSNNQYQWADKTIPTMRLRWNQDCVKASPSLEEMSCAMKLPWICQKNSVQCRSQASILQCFGEKIEVFAENSQQ